MSPQASESDKGFPPGSLEPGRLYTRPDLLELRGLPRDKRGGDFDTGYARDLPPEN